MESGAIPVGAGDSMHQEGSGPLVKGGKSVEGKAGDSPKTIDKMASQKIVSVEAVPHEPMRIDRARVTLLTGSAQNATDQTRNKPTKGKEETLPLSPDRTQDDGTRVDAETRSSGEYVYDSTQDDIFDDSSAEQVYDPTKDDTFDDGPSLLTSVDRQRPSPERDRNSTLATSVAERVNNIALNSMGTRRVANSLSFEEAMVKLSAAMKSATEIRLAFDNPVTNTIEWLAGKGAANELQQRRAAGIQPIGYQIGGFVFTQPGHEHKFRDLGLEILVVTDWNLFGELLSTAYIRAETLSKETGHQGIADETSSKEPVKAHVQGKKLTQKEKKRLEKLEQDLGKLLAKLETRENEKISHAKTAKKLKEKEAEALRVFKNKKQEEHDRFMHEKGLK